MSCNTDGGDGGDGDKALAAAVAVATGAVLEKNIGRGASRRRGAVSYTHLTLPTIYSV